ncbi:MAG: hypothetical protein ACE5GA_06265 [Candidatus Zixiibacteriota bacterium]
MLFDDYLILSVVWFSGLFFVWYGGVAMANPELYRQHQGVTLGGLSAPAPLWWRFGFWLFALSDLIMLYLGIRGFWSEPYLWGALVAHVGLAPRYVRRFLLSKETRTEYFQRLITKGDSRAILTGISSILVGLLIFVIYFRF